MKPNHIAIIPDGNRRWAREKGLPAFEGHKKGMPVIEDIAREAKRQGIKYLTAWGWSRDNALKRSTVEATLIYQLFKEYFEKILTDEEIHRDKVKICVIGEWKDYFPEPHIKAIEKAIEATKDYDNYHFTLLMAYDGKREMAEAFNDASKSGKTITESNLGEFLWTRDLPPVDLVIRTGGDPHWSSGFLMWHTADSELYFTNTFWPAFSIQEFQKAIVGYEKAPRNLGK